MINVNYKIFDPEVSAPLHTLSRKEAKVHFELFVSKIDERIEELKTLLREESIELDLSLESVGHLDRWFVANVNENEKIQGQPDSFSFSLCNDISMYLGKIVTNACSSVNWKLNTTKASDISFHRPVLSGFNVKNKNYCIDFDLVLGQYAHRIIKGNIDEGLLVRMVESALDKCG